MDVEGSLTWSLAIPTHTPLSLKSPLKRSASPSSDSENVAPSNFLSKDGKGFDFSAPLHKSKANIFNLVNTPLMTTPITGLKRKASEAPSSEPMATNRATKAARPETPISAPAGRSPKSKRIGILSRRRAGATPFTRVNPPDFSGASTGGLPFSLDAALKGCVPSRRSPKKAKSVDVHNGKPKSWNFQIYEDSPEEELGNIMEHSTGILDISDDEDNVAKKNDKGKENVPPPEFASMVATAPAPATRKNLMVDEPRSPLGDLEATEFFGAGVDASSVFIVPADEEDVGYESTVHVKNAIDEPLAEESGLDIWESESAKAEEEAATEFSL